MDASIFNLHAKISGDTKPLEKDVERLTKSAALLKAKLADISNFRASAAGFKALDSQIQKVKSSASGMLDSFGGNLASNAVSNITSALVEGTKALTNYSSRMEQTRIGFTTLMGGAEAANKHLAALKKFALETPFEFEGLAKMSQRLQGVGVETRKVIPLIKSIGNIAAATGTIGAERLEGINTAVSQMISKTKVTAEEMEQLAERGVPAWQILAEATGKSQAELRKLSEQGKISSNVMVDALNKMGSTKFAGAMERQSKTFAGAMSNIADIAKQTGEVMFKPIYEEISRFSVKFSQSLQSQDAAAKGEAGKWGFALGESLGDSIARGATSKAQGGGLLGFLLSRDKATYLTKDFAEGILKGATTLTAEFSGTVGVLTDKTTKLQDAVKLSEASFQNLEKRLSSTMETALNFASEFTRVRQAIANSKITLTNEDELVNIRETSKIEANSIREQIKITQQGFAEKIRIHKEAGKDISGIVDEREKQLTKLNNDLFINELNTQKRIKEAEKKIYSDRLKAAIEFKNQSISALQFNFDTSNFNFDRIGDISSDAFNRLKDNTSKTYAEIGKLISEQFQIQLKDESLTAEQRVNIQKGMSAELLRVSEDSRRSLLEIGDRQHSQLIGQMESYRKSATDIYRAVSEKFSSISEAFFNPDTFSSSTLKNLRESLLKAGKQNNLADSIKLADLEAQKLKASMDAIYDNAAKDKDGFSILTSEQNAQWEKLNEGYTKARDKAQGYRNELENLKKSIPGAFNLLEDFASKIAGGSIEYFDIAARKVLDFRQLLARSDIDSEISHIQGLIGLEQKRAGEGVRTAELLELQNRLATAQRSKARLELEQEIEGTKLYNSSLQGLTNTLAQLSAGNIAAFAGLDYNAQTQTLREQISAFQEIANLKAHIASFNSFQALDIEKAKLQEIIALRQAETQKIIEGNQSLQYRLQMMAAQLPTLSTQLKDSYANALEGISSTLAGSLTNWNQGIQGFFASVAKGFADMAQQIITEMLKMLIYKALLKLVSAAAGGGGHEGGHLSGFARGGFTGNMPTDAIAGFVHGKEYVMNAKAVSKFGAGFFEKLNRLQTPHLPQMALAGAGVGSASSTSSHTENHYNFAAPKITIVAPQGSNPQQIARTTTQVMNEWMMKAQYEANRNK